VVLILFCVVVGYVFGWWVVGYCGLVGLVVVLGLFWIIYYFVDVWLSGIGDVIFVVMFIVLFYVLGWLM